MDQVTPPPPAATHGHECRAKSRRPFLLVALVLLAGVAGIRWAAAVKDRWQIHAAEQTALAGALPAGQVSYESRLDLASLIPSVADLPQAIDDNPDHDPDGCVLLPPHVIPPGGVGDPPALQRLHRAGNFTFLTDGFQPVFTAGLRPNADAPETLVLVSYGSAAEDALLFPGGGQFEVATYRPGRWGRWPRLLRVGRFAFASELRSGHLQILTGRRDAARPDAFSIEYMADDRHGLIQGKLAPDGEHIQLNATPIQVSQTPS